MRDPDHIQRICAKISALWATMPDVRFGHLVHYIGGDDVFNVEDDKIEADLDQDLLNAGISPNASAYEADVTPEGPPLSGSGPIA